MYLKSLTDIVTYGQFSRPFLNYIVDNLENELSKENQEIINYIDVLKLKWDAKYEEALEKIEKVITLSKKRSIYYLFLVEKIGILSDLSDKAKIKETFDELRKGFPTLPRYLRGIVVEKLKNVREIYFEENDLKTIRHWSEVYENNPVNKGFILMADAREKKNEEKYEEATCLNIEAFKMLKDVPHPSGIIQALNNISWWLKDIDKSIALNFSFPLGFYLGYYFDDDNFNVFNSFDTIFQVQKESNDPMMYETAFIFSKCLSKVDKERYNILKSNVKSIYQLKYFVFNLDNNYYLNTKTLRNFIKQEVEKEQVSIKELNISKER